MAALSEGFTLCALLPGAGGRPEGLLGVEAGGEPDRVLVTDTRRAVTLYKVSDQKPLGSWTVKQGQNITSPAVCNHETGEYIVVHDDTVLRIWKDDDVNLDKVFKATLSADVYRVHTCPDTEPLVVFKGGAVLFLDALLADPQQEIETILSGEERIRWSKMFVEAGQSVLVYITEKGRDCFVCVWKFSPRILLLRYKLKRYTEDSRVLHFSGSLNNKVFTLLILCSNGHVCQVFVPLVQSDQESEGLLPMSLLLQLPEPTDVGAVAILDEAHIAVLAASPSTKKDCLCIWNTKFQTLQATKDLSQKTSAQLWHHGDKLYLPHGKTMAVVPYRCETSCLASALGKCRNLQNSVPENVSVVNWDMLVGDEPEAKQSDAGSKRSTRQTKNKENTALSRDAPLLITDIKNSTPSEIQEFLQRVAVDTELPDFQITIGRITMGVVSRCRADPTFHPRGALAQLIKTNRLSYSLCPDLVTFALGKPDAYLLQLILQHFPDVPEAVICACLKIFLSVSEDSLTDAPLDLESVLCYIDVAEPCKAPEEKAAVIQNGFSPVTLEEDSCDVQMVEKSSPDTEKPMSPVSIKRAALLNSILISAYSETFLLPHLKDLSADQVILFLKYLQYLYVKCSDNVTINLPGKHVPTINQIMDWMSLVLDSHFTVVVMLPEAKRLLCNLQKFVKSQMKFYSELNKIEGSLSELQRKNKRRDCGRYSIEVLELF